MRPTLLLAVLALLLGAAGTSAWVLVQDIEVTPREHARSAVEEVVAEPLVGDDGAPLLRVDGTPFPAGSRRDGGRIVTPDGLVFRREDGRWVPVRDPAAGGGRGRRGTGRRRVSGDSARGGAPDSPSDAEERAPARGGGRATAPSTTGPARPNALDPADLRGAPAVGRTVTVDLAAEKVVLPPGWQKADAVLTGPAHRRARVDVFDRPEAAERAERDHGDDQRALDEAEAVVAQHGLRGDYYDLIHGNLREVPDVTGATPSFSRIDLAIDFDVDDAFALPFEPETFAVRWRGYLHVPESGKYTFTCGSDDGMTLRVGEHDVVNYARLRPYAETDGSVELDVGRYPIEIVFYENRVYASSRLFWSGPSWEKRIVASRYLSPPDELVGMTQPHVTRIEPASARLGDTVTLMGVGFSPDPAANRVTFAGVPGDIVEASATRLVVEVPVGAETGDVTAKVGELTSLPRRFTVDSVTGLFAEYFLIGQDLSTMPDLDALTPYFVRLDGPLDYHQDLLWSLPYEPDVFAARYTGLLYVPDEDAYRVTLGSDDGAFVEIDGKPYLGAPGLHAYEETSRTTRFTQGFHPIRITFFENRGVARLRLFWQRPHEPERTPIPRGHLFPPEELAAAPAPVLSSVPAGALGQVITITGDGFGSEPGVVRVAFPGDVWARPESVENGALTVRVPLTAGSGDLRVTVGVRKSNALHFARTTPEGLTAEIHAFTSEDDLRATSLDVLAGRTPNHTRIDTTWRLEKKADWDAPFPMKNVAVHWHGTMGVHEAVDLSWILQADDGAHLFVDGQHVLDNRPYHGLQERFGRSVLRPGEHTIDIWYFQAGGDAKFHLFWNPWGLRDHREVPARWFRPTRDAAPDAGGN
jgi:hypothetical protein